MTELNINMQAIRVISNLIGVGEEQGHTRLAFKAEEIARQMEANQKTRFMAKRRAKAHAKNMSAVSNAFEFMFETDERVKYADEDTLVIYYMNEVKPVTAQSLTKSDEVEERSNQRKRPTPTAEELVPNIVFNRVNRIVQNAFEQQENNVTVTLDDMLRKVAFQMQSSFVNGVNSGRATLLLKAKNLYTPLIQKAMQDYANDVEAPMTAEYLDNKLTINFK